MNTLIEFQQVCKYYYMGDTTATAANHISFQIYKGEFVAIVGSSGSGKSTCMNIIGCLDVPSEGTYLLSGQDVGQMNKNQLAEIRNELLGFIFQQYNLLPKLNLVENVEVPLMYAGVPKGERQERALAALKQVGLGNTSLWSSPAASSSGCPSPGLWWAVRRSSWPTSPPGPWTPAPAVKFWPCSRTSTARATPWFSSPTTTPSPSRPSGSSAWRTERWSTTDPPTPPRRWSPPGSPEGRKGGAHEHFGIPGAGPEKHRLQQGAHPSDHAWHHHRRGGGHRHCGSGQRPGGLRHRELLRHGHQHPHRHRHVPGLHPLPGCGGHVRHCGGEQRVSGPVLPHRDDGGLCEDRLGNGRHHRLSGRQRGLSGHRPADHCPGPKPAVQRHVHPGQGVCHRSLSEPGLLRRKRRGPDPPGGWPEPGGRGRAGPAGRGAGGGGAATTACTCPTPPRSASPAKPARTPSP